MKPDNKPGSARYILKNLKKNEPKTGWGPVSAILVSLGIYFGSQIVAGYLIIQYLFIAGTERESITSAVDGSVILQFLFILFAELISLSLLWLFLRRRKILLGKIGIRKPSGKNLAYALPAYGIYIVAILMIFALVQRLVPHIDTSQEQQVGFQTASGTGPLLLVFIALVVLPALVEEVLIRGFLYGGLRNKLPVVASAIIASLIFGAAHLQLGDGSSPVWIAAIDTFILSLVLVWLREKTGNIWAGVVVHMAKNSLAFLSLFIFKVV